MARCLGMTLLAQGSWASSALAVPSVRTPTEGGETSPRLSSSFMYEAPATCPGREGFRREIAERLDGIRELEEMAGRVRIRVHERRGYEAELVLEKPLGSPRVVRGSDCVQLVRALAIVAVVAIESAEGLPAEPAEPTKESLSSDPNAKVSQWVSSLLIGGGVRAGHLGNTAPALLLAWSMHRVRGEEMTFPESRVSLLGAANKYSNLGSSYWFRWAAIRPELCPVAFSLFSKTLLRICSGLELGAASVAAASAGPVLDAESRVLPWVAGSASLEGEWKLSSRLALVVSGGAVVPFLRHRYFFARDNGSVEFLQDAPVSSSVAGALSLSF